MRAAEIVQEARASLSGLPSEQALHLLTSQEGATEDEDGYDPHAELRTQVLKALQNTLSSKDRPLIHFLMIRGVFLIFSFWYSYTHDCS